MRMLKMQIFTNNECNVELGFYMIDEDDDDT
jgi:hypothetical protein